MFTERLNNMSLENDGTVDITDLVENMRSVFVQWASTYLWGLLIAVPGLGWIAAPILKVLFGAALKWLLTKLSQSAVMLAFFLNTAIRKASQASDFADAVKHRKSLPTNASEEEYEKAERAQMLAFNRFVRVTN